MTHLIAEIIGVFGFSATILSYQCKDRRHLLLLQLFSTTCWATHFGLLGAWAGCILNVIGMARCIVFADRGRDTKMGRIADWLGWLPIFIVLSCGATLLTWKGPFDLLPMLGMVLTTFALRATSSTTVRLLTLPNDPMWLIYNASEGSVSGVLTEVAIMCSIIVGMIRHDIPALKERFGKKTK